MKLIHKINAARDRLLDRMISSGKAKAAGGMKMACRCVPNPAICPGGHERLCDGKFVGCC